MRAVKPTALVRLFLAQVIADLGPCQSHNRIYFANRVIYKRLRLRIKGKKELANDLKGCTKLSAT